MYEICALLAAKKVKKARKPAATAIRVGMACTVHGKPGIVTRKDASFKAAYYVAFDGVEAPYSLSRDMIVIA